MDTWLMRIREEGSLRYAFAETSAGRLLVIVSSEGVVDVILGDSREQMLSSALRRFPGMGLYPDKGEHAEWVAAVVKRVELPDDATIVPVDLGPRHLRRVAV